MNILITGAAGNLGTFLARHLANGPHHLTLMIHRRLLPEDLAVAPNVSVVRADLGEPASLAAPCRGVDCIVHFAGLLFAPRPERFLPKTNLGYVRHLTTAAAEAGVGRFILVSFPHVEGESTPEAPARGLPEGRPPTSVHARTRLAAERHLFKLSAGTSIVPIALRAGMIYARGVLMIEAARWLMRRRLLGVWGRPTWIHLLALPDFLTATTAAIEGPAVSGIYNLGDDLPLTLQEFLDAAAAHWGHRRPWRAPAWAFSAAGAVCEVAATVLRTPSPLTRDFIRIGMASYAMDTTRMKRELLPVLGYPTLRDGLSLL
ncbi:MAG: NAD-dependent epimerase/dehydratase family protein [bacterium]